MGLAGYAELREQSLPGASNLSFVEGLYYIRDPESVTPEWPASAAVIIELNGTRQAANISECTPARRELFLGCFSSRLRPQCLRKGKCG